MQLKVLSTGKVISCTQSSWEDIVKRKKDSLFQVIDRGLEVTPIATKRIVTEVQVPPMPPLPELEEIKESQKENSRGRKKKTNE